MLSIAITATFTAEPIEPALKFWLKELGEEPSVRFASYAQVFQQLLDPGSLLRRNQGGINLVLVRFEDWGRFQQDRFNEETLVQNVNELASALHAFARETPTPTLVWIAPPSEGVSPFNELTAVIAEQQERLRAAISVVESLHWLDAESVDLYRVPRREDAERDRLAHIPFTPSYYAALATAAARRIHALRTPPHKVLVLDCDNTLWQGIVGEDGPRGVKLTPGTRAVQEFALAQQQQGTLLCLASKNTELDVFSGFLSRVSRSGGASCLRWELL
jgi:predicted enzyme involved in methoxymalonyl-ACP biosynthesis